MKKLCTICGKQIKTKNHTTLFCSDECRDKYKETAKKIHTKEYDNRARCPSCKCLVEKWDSLCDWCVKLKEEFDPQDNICRECGKPIKKFT